MGEEKAYKNILSKPRLKRETRAWLLSQYDKYWSKSGKYKLPKSSGFWDSVELTIDYTNWGQVILKSPDYQHEFHLGESPKDEEFVDAARAAVRLKYALYMLKEHYPFRRAFFIEAKWMRDPTTPKTRVLSTGRDDSDEPAPKKKKNW